MKHIRASILSITAVLLLGVSLAFIDRHNDAIPKKFTIQYSLYLGATNPPAFEVQVDDSLNWGEITTTQPDNRPSGNKWYYLKFNDATTTLSQAYDILGARVAFGQSIVSGTSYTDGNGHFVVLIKGL